MSRTGKAVYVVPIKSDGTEATFAPGADATLTGRGVYTLSASTTYYFPCSIDDAGRVSVHLRFDAAIIITSAKIEDTNANVSEVPWYASASTGMWVPETPPSMYVGTVGSGTTAISGVVATAGSAAGAAMWHLDGIASRRVRLAVAVGGTGGEVRVAIAGKD